MARNRAVEDWPGNKPGWCVKSIYRILPGYIEAFFNQNSLELSGPRGSLSVDISLLKTSVVSLRGWRWSCLVLTQLDGNSLRLAGVSNDSASTLAKYLSQTIADLLLFQYQQLGRSARDALKALDALAVCTRYLRRADWERWFSLYQHLSPFFTRFDRHYFFGKCSWYEPRFYVLERIFAEGKAFCRKHNDAFIAEEMARYSVLFDSIESRPLTPSQRQACVQDEVANLILAGAGTGKTSVMVAKAGYLLASGLAQADEILLLAFGKDAAQELSERIQKHLKDGTVVVKTFHGLGRDIVTAVDGKKIKVSKLATNEESKVAFVTKTLRELVVEDANRKLLLECLILLTLAPECASSELSKALKSSDEKALITTKNMQPITAIFANLLPHYKASGISQKAFSERLIQFESYELNKRLFKLFLPVYKAYNEQLKVSGEIDFTDMIQQATQYLTRGRYKSRFRYVLVDEFQDISVDRVSLIQALLKQVRGASLFAVGDDWQAIYRFAGSDVAVTRRFESYFGESTQSVLDTTFRFNNQIAIVAARFVQRNPQQIKKEITSSDYVEANAVYIVPTADEVEALNATLTRISKIKPKIPKRLLILARYSHLLEAVREVPAYDNLLIETMTIHASKGREADFVIVLGLTADKLGFPARQSDSALIRVVLPEEEIFPFAEERRLFYVALTRAKQQIYLLSNIKAPSVFVDEVAAYENVSVLKLPRQKKKSES